VNAGLREEFGKRTVHDVVSGERDKVMEQMREKADLDARKIGVQIVDVRVKRVELPNDVSDSVYRRMEAERKRVANELRSQGAADAEKIRADADKQREVIVAEAYRDAQKMKGEGDAKATAIYAQAFGQQCRILCLLSQPGGLSRQLQGQDRRDRRRTQFGLLQVHEEHRPGVAATKPANDRSPAACVCPDAGSRRGVAVRRPEAAWRETFRRLIRFSDGQIRFIGLTSMLVGLVLLMIFR
jgi:hypothetical protein